MRPMCMPYSKHGLFPCNLRVEYIIFDVIPVRLRVIFCIVITLLPVLGYPVSNVVANKSWSLKKHTLRLLCFMVALLMFY